MCICSDDRSAVSVRSFFFFFFFSLREPAQLHGRERTSKPRKSTKSEIYCPWSLEIELRSAICSRNERHQWCFHFSAFRATILPSFLVFFLFFLVSRLRERGEISSNVTTVQSRGNCATISSPLLTFEWKITQLQRGTRTKVQSAGFVNSALQIYYVSLCCTSLCKYLVKFSLRNV